MLFALKKYEKNILFLIICRAKPTAYLVVGFGNFFFLLLGKRLEFFICRAKPTAYLVVNILLPLLLRSSTLLPKMLCNGNGAICHLQNEMGFVEDFCYSL